MLCIHRNIRCYLFNLLLTFKVYMYIQIILSSKSSFIQFYIEVPPLSSLLLFGHCEICCCHSSLLILSPHPLSLLSVITTFHHAQAQEIPQVTRHPPSQSKLHQQEMLPLPFHSPNAYRL